MTREMRNSVLVTGAALTIVTGVISVLFSSPILWAPGILAVFLVGGGPESLLNVGWFLSIAALINFLIYCALSWLFFVVQNRLREENEKARSYSPDARSQQ